jgi:flagellar motor switch protein FliM
MTAADEPQKYDFRQPRRLADDIEHLLASWQSGVAPLVTDRWSQQLGCDVAWQVQPLETLRSSDVSQGISETALATEILLGDPPETMWIVLARPLGLALVSCMLGEQLDALPEDRPLTDVEASLMELAIQEFAEALLDGQPDPQPLRCDYSGPRRPSDLTRVFSPQEPLTVVRFQLNGSFGDGSLLWLLSQAATLQFVARVSEGRLANRRSSSELEEIVRKIPLQIVVRLGRANLHVSELMNLRPGDVLILDQRVNEPLWGEVATAVKFRGWPGRVGKRQALQITGWVQPEE